MHAKVDKGAEIRDVGNSPFQFHAFFQVSNLLHVFAELGNNKFVSRVAARLEQLFANVCNRIPSTLRFESFEVDRVDLSRILDEFADGSA